MGVGFSKMFFKLFFSKREMRLVMIGLDGAGKTTVLYRLRLNEVISTIPTIGFNYEVIQYKNITFTLWDLGGQDKMRKLWPHYYHGCHAVIFVIDSSDRDRIEEARDELHYLMRDEKVKDAILLVFANKQDMPRALTTNELTQKLELHSLSRRPWHVQSACAITGTGLYEGLDWLCTTLNKRK
eukprot:TRINITY_DN15895_c0_g1::TRINITY_DN15895_c0_g1_i1::g.22539::m.22539 TRINITY_DN15895_c0_g1::TRINITY_DN15895_c0_g1_i1::g.22539  ORF type:complete len:183 (-),score=12.58,sp/P0DH91/ARF2B_ARATH/58.99/3e-82,Arf/PF00025.16/2.1e-70,Ras/PF00071.17/3.3e-13,SRPRB/PF09439.5/7.3e-12,G-alpha/PF00503.15/0.79,G-alpha/PF00503.15/4.2e-08,Gtr1_RagA/PF04670.7/5.2e-11,Miro/PF08477.8/1.8e-10,MMR_HSR1/PF01926.18/0.00012,GTP_EFTU/PF00009.22/1.1e+02,GTP_EFTU/PF00009.22/0.0018,AAA_22/PF13401.1/0.15,AAA_33/PF13671.1/0.097,